MCPFYCDVSGAKVHRNEDDWYRLTLDSVAYTQYAITCRSPFVVYNNIWEEDVESVANSLHKKTFQQ